MGKGLHLRGSRGCTMALTIIPHLTPKLKKEWCYSSTPALSFHGLFSGRILSFFYLFVQDKLSSKYCT
jgi:hypothetical protein